MKSEYLESVLNDADIMTFGSNAEDDFLTALEQIDLDTMWSNVSTKSVAVHELVGHEDVGSFEGAEADQIADTLANTGLYITVGDKSYLVGSSAIKSLQDRAQITGSGLSKLCKDDYATVLNRLLAVQSNQSRVMARAGKVRFVASGDSKDYSVLPMAELVNATRDFLAEHFGTVQFEGGHFEHTLSTASWKPNINLFKVFPCFFAYIRKYFSQLLKRRFYEKLNRVCRNSRKYVLTKVWK